MYVHVYSGLMSRCITLAHAYYLLKNYGGGRRKRLVVVWPLDKDCGIHFWEVFAHDMFEDIELKVIEVNLKYLNYSEYGGFWSNIREKHFVKAIRFVITVFKDRCLEKLVKIIFGKKYCLYQIPIEIEELSDEYMEYMFNVWKRVKNVLSGNRKIYIHAFGGIIRDKEQENVNLSVIKFRQEYWKTVEEIINPNEKIIGIHIRRTDHQRAIEASGTDAFVKKIDEILEKQGDAKFFLATDDISEEENLKNRYGDKIIVQKNKEWGRAKSSEMKSGIIDCLCLSRCEYILGSYTSVFSSFAAKYGGKELIICKNDN